MFDMGQDQAAHPARAGAQLDHIFVFQFICRKDSRQQVASVIFPANQGLVAFSFTLID
jgi:hypothetical protein